MTRYLATLTIIIAAIIAYLVWRVPYVVAAIMIAVAATALMVAGLVAYYAVRTKRQTIRLADAETRIREAELINRLGNNVQFDALIVAQLEQMRNGTAYIQSIDGGAVHFSQFTKSGGTKMAIKQQEQTIELLPALDNVQRTLIVGGSNSGKTTLLKHIVARRTGAILVLDPHAYPEKYSSGCKVIGVGRDYPAIDIALQGLIGLMTARYAEIGRGEVAEMAHPPLTIVVDEWRAIVHNLGKPAGGYIATLLTESRKAAFSLFVGTHSERAAPLGIKGEADLKEGFTVVRLGWADGQRQATVNLNGSGLQVATLPGAFSDDAKSIISLPVAHSSQAYVAKQMHGEGASLRAIARELFDGDGGNQLKQVKDLLGA